MGEPVGGDLDDPSWAGHKHSLTAGAVDELDRTVAEHSGATRRPMCSCRVLVRAGPRWTRGSGGVECQDSGPK